MTDNKIIKLNVIVSHLFNIFQDETLTETLYSGETIQDADKTNDNDKLKSFFKEKDAFNSLADNLKQKYRGKYVAIYNEKIADADEDRSKLIERFYNNHGNVVVYINKVDSKRTVYKIHARIRKL